MKAIAFYLPQYHPIPENDEWWGKGFTEWTNVTKAKPVFRGHSQPNLPTDLGFYDLRLHEARQAQATLAQSYGIHGFCYYHYWFNGRRLLERPFNEVLSSGSPNLPFCLCWANENWTRAWDGRDEQVLAAQKYNVEDDENHIAYLVNAFRDERYIRVNGRPLFLVYRTEKMPNPARTAEVWRNYALKSGVGDLFLVRVESFDSSVEPRSIGFDAAVEFAPDWRNLGRAKSQNSLCYRLSKLGLFPTSYLDNRIVEYSSMVENMLNKDDPNFLRFRCVTPSFDNSPRRSSNAVILKNSNPELYGAWLKEIVDRARLRAATEERIVFINAWNEWGEGNYLEPDRKWGRGYLDATREALFLGNT